MKIATRKAGASWPPWRREGALAVVVLASLVGLLEAAFADLVPKN